MRNSILWLALAVTATLLVEGRGMAQPPDRRPGPRGPLERTLDDMKLSETNRATALAAIRAYQDNGRRLMELAGADLQLKMKEILSAEEYSKVREATARFRRPPGGAFRSPGVDEVVERILSFDKNKDGKVTKDELPERMQYLIEKGDTNKDGALDREEIRKLAVDLARDEGPRRGGPGGPRGQAVAGNGFPPGVIERAVNDLKLADKKKETATAAIKANQENVRKLTELARADLLLKMEELLGAEDLQKFKTALERQPGFGPGPGRPPFPGRFGPPGPDRP
jgi:hypothetical protein